MPASPEKKKNTRAKILDSAFELFKNNSVHSTAVDDVVKSAGVAKGTFYLYFKDKYDLLDHLVLDKSSDMIVEAFNNSFNDPDAPLPEKVDAFADCVMDELSSNREITALLQKNLSRCLTSLDKTGSESLKAVYDEVKREIVKMGVSKDDADKRIYFVTDLLGSVCCDAIVNGEPFELDSVRAPLKNAIRSILFFGGESLDK